MGVRRIEDKRITAVSIPCESSVNLLRVLTVLVISVWFYVEPLIPGYLLLRNRFAPWCQFV